MSLPGYRLKRSTLWVEGILGKFRYRKLGKKERGLVRAYIRKVAGYSESQTTRLIKKSLAGKLKYRPRRRRRFPRKYRPADIALLAKTDNAHSRLSGPATQAILKREYTRFGRTEYENLNGLSVAHLYRLRKKRVYETYETTFTKTTPVTVAIGERRQTFRR